MHKNRILRRWKVGNNVKPDLPFKKAERCIRGVNMRRTRVKLQSTGDGSSEILQTGRGITIRFTVKHRLSLSLSLSNLLRYDPGSLLLSIHLIWIMYYQIIGLMHGARALNDRSPLIYMFIVYSLSHNKNARYMRNDYWHYISIDFFILAITCIYCQHKITCYWIKPPDNWTIFRIFFMRCKYTRHIWLALYSEEKMPHYFLYNELLLLVSD